jgi:hypothetical protein
MRLEAENVVLRHQLIVLRRKLRGRVQLANSDRWFFVQLYHWFPSILQVLTIIRPETLIRWHRSGFRCYWHWKSRSLGGRPQIEAGLRALIRQISMENPLWGAPRIHGELLKVGFEVAQSIGAVIANSTAASSIKHDRPDHIDSGRLIIGCSTPLAKVKSWRTLCCRSSLCGA